MLNKQRIFIIVSGPSGAGKTLFIQKSLKLFPQLSNSRSFTTRAPRSNEKEGEFYYFISREEFKKKKAQKELLEWAVVHNELYATSKKEVERIWKNNKAIIKDLDYQGFFSIKKIYHQCVGIFIYPPSINELKRRILKRGAVEEKQLKERLTKAKEEMAQGHSYDFKIVNDDFETSWLEFKNILTERLNPE